MHGVKTGVPEPRPSETGPSLQCTVADITAPAPPARVAVGPLRFRGIFLAAMTDHDIRAVLKRELRAQYQGDVDTMIIEELGLRHGKTRVTSPSSTATCMGLS